MRTVSQWHFLREADQMRGKQILMTALIALGVVIAYDKQMNK